MHSPLQCAKAFYIYLTSTSACIAFGSVKIPIPGSGPSERLQGMNESCASEPGP